MDAKITDELDALKQVNIELSQRIAKDARYIVQVENERDVLQELCDMQKQMLDDRATELKSLLNKL